MFSAIAWLAGVVSLNDLRLSANLPGDNFKTAVAGDGTLQSYTTIRGLAVCYYRRFISACLIRIAVELAQLRWNSLSSHSIAYLIADR